MGVFVLWPKLLTIGPLANLVRRLATRRETALLALRHIPKELGRIDAKRCGQLQDDRQCRNVVSALDEAEVADVHLCALGKRFLRPAAILAKAPNGGAEDDRFFPSIFSS